MSVVNTDLLLPVVNGTTVDPTILTNRQVIALLLSSGVMSNLVLLTRRCHANLEFAGRGKMVCGTNITYTCAFKTAGNNFLSANQTLYVGRDVLTAQSKFGQLIRLIFEYGTQVYRQGMYAQRGIPTTCLNIIY